MRALLKIVLCSLLILEMGGCASAPVAGKSSIAFGDGITVVGFVKAPGKYSYHEGMTVADALHDAGGYGRCRSCQEFFHENGWHPTFDQPPNLQRAGQALKLPKIKAEWMKFPLEREDEIKFRHVMF